MGETTDQLIGTEMLTSLEDVTVETMGLVEAGAVGETFFLLKREGGAMDEETADLEELKITEDVIKEEGLNGFLARLGMKRLLDLVNKGQAVEEPPPAETEAEPPAEIETEKAKAEKMLSAGAKRGIMALLNTYGKELPPNMVGMLRGMLSGSDDMDDGKDKTEKKDNEVTAMTGNEDKDKATTTTTEQPDPKVEKGAETASPAADPALLARLEKAEAATQATLARLEKAEQELEKARTLARQEREARQRVTYIEKARELPHLAINADEMGAVLHRLAKTDEAANVEKAADAEDRQADYGYIFGVLKAADEQLRLAGFFKEAGTSKDPGEMDLVEKAALAVEKGEYATLKEALLNVSPQEADAYRGQFRSKN